MAGAGSAWRCDGPVLAAEGGDVDEARDAGLEDVVNFLKGFRFTKDGLIIALNFSFINF